jgi:hypothetical protein
MDPVQAGPRSERISPKRFCWSVGAIERP